MGCRDTQERDCSTLELQTIHRFSQSGRSSLLLLARWCLPLVPGCGSDTASPAPSGTNVPTLVTVMSQLSTKHLHKLDTETPRTKQESRQSIAAILNILLDIFAVFSSHISQHRQGDLSLRPHISGSVL